MYIDINELLANMLDAIKITVKDDWSVVKEAANSFVQTKKNRLELLVSLRLSGEISDEFFSCRIIDEKEILASELHSIAILNKVLAQNAANAAIKVIESATESALDIIL